MPDKFRTAIAALAILSMTLGNVVALAQRDIKRLLAYSGIAHMGYVTIALVVFGRDALAAVIVYFFAYLVSNAGAFAAVSALYRDETKAHPVALLAGDGRRAPFAAAVLALCFFSLAGIPATAGFIGKFFLFKAALESGPVCTGPDRRRQQSRVRRVLPEGRLHPLHARTGGARRSAGRWRRRTGSHWPSARRAFSASASSRRPSGGSRSMPPPRFPFPAPDPRQTQPPSPRALTARRATAKRLKRRDEWHASPDAPPPGPGRPQPDLRPLRRPRRRRPRT